MSNDKKTVEEILNDQPCFRGHKHVYHYLECHAAMTDYAAQQVATEREKWLGVLDGEIMAYREIQADCNIGTLREMSVRIDALQSIKDKLTK